MDREMMALSGRLALGNGLVLRLLSGMELLEARREAHELSRLPGERPLCSNACLLARALERQEDHSPVFSGGEAVLAGLTVEEIAALSARWAELRRENDPGLELSGEELEQLKKNSVPAPVSGCGGGY